MKFVTAFVGSARRAPSGEPREITGRVESLSKGALTLESGQVRLTEETKFVRGQPVERDEVKPGAEVRAAYEPRGDLAYAKEVEVLPGGQEK